MIDQKDILKTIDMIARQNLDIRTITMGISLFDCVSTMRTYVPDECMIRSRVKQKDLVRTGEAIENEFGIPIVNKRISVTPVSLISQGCGDYVKFARAMDKAAHEMGVDFIGGYSAFVQKAATAAEAQFIDSIPQALSETGIVCSSVNVATTRVGINMDAVKRMGEIIKRKAPRSPPREGGMGAAKLVVFANAVEDNPFMAGAFHGTGEEIASST